MIPPFCSVLISAIRVPSLVQIVPVSEEIYAKRLKKDRYNICMKPIGFLPLTRYEVVSGVNTS